MSITLNPETTRHSSQAYQLVLSGSSIASKDQAAQNNLVPSIRSRSLTQSELGVSVPAFIEVLSDRSHFERSQKVLEQIPKEKFKHLIWVGIGGSSLGPKVIADEFDLEGRIHFLENPDLLDAQKLLARGVKLSESLWVIVSKSGRTLETLTWVSWFEQEISSSLGRPLAQSFENLIAERCLVISDPNQNALNLWAEKRRAWRLEIPPRLGGRFSVVSAMGLVVPWFLGLNYLDLVKGAQESLVDPLTYQVADQFCAQAIESFKREEWISFLWGYHSTFRTMGAWIQQLWAESLAKEKTKDGLLAPRVSTPLVALGSVDQHSLLQQVLEGARDKWVVLFGKAGLPQTPLQSETPWTGLPYLDKFDFNQVLPILRLATRKALEDKKISFVELISGPTHLKQLGAQFIFWELVIATLALHFNIDAFDQPGVELAKRHIPGLFG